jgi:hypothetical protein
VPAVIAMQYRVNDGMAIAFAGVVLIATTTSAGGTDVAGVNSISGRADTHAR